MSNPSQSSISTSLSHSANEFAIDLFQCYLRRHGDKYKNLLLSPYLIYHSLAMMLVGAKGNTAKQLLDLLHLRKEISVQHRGFLLLTEQLIHGNHDFVHVASFIYLDKSAHRTERFKNILRDYYETKPKKIEFNDVELMVRTVNEDVARTTENIYNDILSKQEAQKLEKTFMLLVNAVFFRGFWLSNFTDVNKSPFFGSYTVQMMSKIDYLPILTDEQLDARVIRMPFEASDLVMLLILPNDKQSNAVYLTNKISATKVEQLMSDLSRSRSKTLQVSMPKFCIDSGRISIQSTLVTLGAADLFDKSKADLSGLCENKQVWLNKILHRCFIICDNRGSITSSTFEKAQRRHAKIQSKSSSSKETGQSGGSQKQITEFVADHPFMYIIIDSVTKTILLIGLFTDPSETLEVIHENQLSPEEAHQIYTEGVYKT